MAAQELAAAELETEDEFAPVTETGDTEFEPAVAAEPEEHLAPMVALGPEAESEIDAELHPGSERAPQSVFAAFAAFVETEPEPEPHEEFFADWKREMESAPHEKSDPVWVPEPEMAPHAEFDPDWEPDGEPNPTPSFGPVHRRSRKTGATQRRSPVFMATAIVACAFLLVVGIAAIGHSLHHATTPPAAPPASTGSPAAPTSPATARVQSATDSVDSATTSARAGLASITGFPTPSNVANVINPYVASLQLYDTFMSGASVPAPASSAAAATLAQVRNDVTFFGTIDGLPPIRLGTYLTAFTTDVSRLQATLSTLEQALHG